MAIAAVNLQYSPGSPLVGQQLQSQGGLTGSEAKSLYGIGTAIGDGATTSFTVNWLDGVQTPFKQTGIIQLQAVTAPATINGVANVAIYSGVGAMGQLRVGQTVTTAGFSNAGNNSTSLVILSLTTNSFNAVNASSVAETNPAGTVTFTLVQGAAGLGALIPMTGGNARALFGPFNNIQDTAATSITAIVSAVTQTGCTITPSSTLGAGVTFSVAFTLYPSN
jgi:hypothetical protein